MPKSDIAAWANLLVKNKMCNREIDLDDFRKEDVPKSAEELAEESRKKLKQKNFMATKVFPALREMSQGSRGFSEGKESESLVVVLNSDGRGVQRRIERGSRTGDGDGPVITAAPSSSGPSSFPRKTKRKKKGASSARKGLVETQTELSALQQFRARVLNKLKAQNKKGSLGYSSVPPSSSVVDASGGKDGAQPPRLVSPRAMMATSPRSPRSPRSTVSGSPRSRRSARVKHPHPFSPSNPIRAKERLVSCPGR